MKKRMRFAALLTGAVLACAALTAPAGAAETARPAVVQQMYERIAGWDDASLDACYISGGGHNFYTPKRLYLVNWRCYDGFRVAVRPDTALTADDVVNAWKKILTDIGCGADAEAWQHR